MRLNKLKICACLTFCVIVVALLSTRVVRHRNAVNNGPASESPPASLGQSSEFGGNLLVSQTQADQSTSFGEALKRINALISRRDYTTALEKCDELTRLARTPWETHRAKLTEANLLLATNQHEKAWTLLRELIETVEDPTLIGFVATKYCVAGRAVGEIESAILSLESKWGDVPAGLREARVMAEIFMHNKQPQKEMAVRLRIAPDDDGAQNLLRVAELQAQVGDNASAANTCALLSDLHPENSSFFLLKKATFERANQDVSSALSTCGVILASPSADSVTLLHTGLLLRELRNFDQASTAFAFAEERATEAFRKERCNLELCRTRILANKDDDSTWNRVQSLAASGLADGVKFDARAMLAGRQ